MKGRNNAAVRADGSAVGLCNEKGAETGEVQESDEEPRSLVEVTSDFGTCSQNGLQARPFE